MKDIKTKEEYEFLVEEIWRHNRLYFQKAAPEISDEEFDELTRLLEKTEAIHPEWISEASPSRKVGEEPLEGLREVAHSVPMLSLEKCFTREELEAFYQRVEKLSDRKKPAFFGEPKIDGLALSALYEKGTLTLALTRGNGEVGSDITHNFRCIRSVPLKLPKDVGDLFEVRGEVFLPFHAFTAINKQRELEGLPLFANPRNAAAGSLKLLDPKEFAKRGNLSVIFYSIARSSKRHVRYQHEVLPFLHSLGLPTALEYEKEGVIISLVHSVDEMMAYQDALLKKRDRLPFGIDGAVFKLDTLDDAEAISPTAKHSRTAIAWKFQAEEAWTHLKAISLQVGRTGVITPVAELEPVELAGSTVSRATLHNEDEVLRKDLRPGDRVLIAKGGDVIPKVIRRDPEQTTRGHPWHMVAYCPACATKLVRAEEEVAWYCPNHACPDQVVRRLVHFVGKDGLDIEFVGEALIEKLYRKGKLSSYSDLFLLTKETLFTVENIKEKAASRILSSIESAKTPSLDRFLMALGITFVGTGAARLLAERFVTLDALLQATKDELIAIAGIGEKGAEAVFQTCTSPEFLAEVNALQQAGVSVQPFQKKETIGNAFQGEMVVLTGTLSSMTRTEAAKVIEDQGGKVANAVTKATTLVVVGSDAGSKAEKAQKLGISILNEEQFLERLHDVIDPKV